MTLFTPLVLCLLSTLSSSGHCLPASSGSGDISKHVVAKRAAPVNPFSVGRARRDTPHQPRRRQVATATLPISCANTAQEINVPITISGTTYHFRLDTGSGSFWVAGSNFQCYRSLSYSDPTDASYCNVAQPYKGTPPASGKPLSAPYVNTGAKGTGATLPVNVGGTAVSSVSVGIMSQVAGSADGAVDVNSGVLGMTYPDPDYAENSLFFQMTKQGTPPIFSISFAGSKSGTLVLGGEAPGGSGGNEWATAPLVPAEGGVVNSYQVKPDALVWGSPTAKRAEFELQKRSVSYQTPTPSPMPQYNYPQNIPGGSGSSSPSQSSASPPPPPPPAAVPIKNPYANIGSTSKINSNPGSTSKVSANSGFKLSTSKSDTTTDSQKSGTSDHPSYNLLIDSGSTGVVIQHADAEAINNLFPGGAEYDASHSAWKVNCNAKPPTFGVKFGEQTAYMKPENMVQPNDSAGPGKCYSNILAPSSSDQAQGSFQGTLGLKFLLGVVSVFDVGKNEVRLKNN